MSFGAGTGIVEINNILLKKVEINSFGKKGQSEQSASRFNYN